MKPEHFQLFIPNFDAEYRQMSSQEGATLSPALSLVYYTSQHIMSNNFAWKKRFYARWTFTSENQMGNLISTLLIKQILAVL